jgi:hypothetical protein
MDIPRPDNFNECYLYEGTYCCAPPLPCPPFPANNAPRTTHEQS